MSSRERRSPEPPTAGRQASMNEARTQLRRLLTEVEAGKTFIITRHGRPVATLAPVQPTARPTFGAMRNRIGFDETFYDPLPDEELRAWHGA